MLVHVIADDADRLPGLCLMLQAEHQVSWSLVCGSTDRARNAQVLVVRADLRAVSNIAALKQALESARQANRRIFVVESPSRLCVSQAYALGATEVLVGGVNAAKLLRAVSGQALPAGTDSARSAQTPGAVGSAANTLVSMFRAVTDGFPIDLNSANQAGRQIVEHIGEHGLSDWLQTVRRHHEGTYQHCLLVAGVAADFGLSLGLRATDLERLYSAALFHDIGKARIPLAILDKPERLSVEERTIIESHPVAGYEALRQQNGFSPEILDAVRHHHEYLDGSGYPDRLAGSRISDVVRILTISDIFAALIEHRSYRPTMPRAEAYAVLCGMSDKLEAALVRAFKPVALNR